MGSLCYTVLARRGVLDLHLFCCLPFEMSSKNLSCSKIESTFVMTPHGFKGLILQGGDYKF